VSSYSSPIYPLNLDVIDAFSFSKQAFHKNLVIAPVKKDDEINLEDIQKGKIIDLSLKQLE